MKEERRDIHDPTLPGSTSLLSHGIYFLSLFLRLHLSKHSLRYLHNKLILHPLDKSIPKVKRDPHREETLEYISLGHLLVCKSKNLGSWVYQLIIQFIVVSSFFLQDYISFIFSLVFFFFVFFFGVVVFLSFI